MLPEIPEASGLAVSRRDPGLLWSHNDSGSAAVLFALDTAGTMRGRVRVPVKTRDWEDVSAARATLVAKGVKMGPDPGAGNGLRTCEGEDPAGNVFQLSNRE